MNYIFKIPNCFFLESIRIFTAPILETAVVTGDVLNNLVILNVETYVVFPMDLKLMHIFRFEYYLGISVFLKLHYLSKYLSVTN